MEEHARKRLNASEQEGLLNLFGVLQLLQEHKLDKRLAGIKYGKRDLGMMRAKIAALAAAIVDTVPTQQLKGIYKNLDSLCVSVGVKSVGGYRYSEYGRWISDAALLKIGELCREHCMMCTLDTGQQHKCEFRKAMDELPVDLPEYSTGCPYYTLWAQI